MQSFNVAIRAIEAAISRRGPSLAAVEQLSLDQVVRSRGFLRQVETHYPDFEGWFSNKVLPGCVDGSRAVFATFDGPGETMSGLAIAKRGDLELKICTLFVHPRHGGRGNGTGLLRSAIDWLGSPFPVITVGAARLPLFRALFDRHGFKLTSTSPGLYRVGETEHAFNEARCAVTSHLGPAGRDRCRWPRAPLPGRHGPSEGFLIKGVH